MSAAEHGEDVTATERVHEGHLGFTHDPECSICDALTTDHEDCRGQWCCGCVDHPIGKPWHYPEAWDRHYAEAHAGEFPGRTVGVSADIIRALRVEITDALAERARARTTFDAAPRSDSLSAEGYHRADAFWLGLSRAVQIAEVLHERECIRVSTAGGGR